MQTETLSVVLASPSDVSEERDLAERAVDETNDTLRSVKHFCRFEIVRWEHHVQPGLHVHGPQGKIDEDLRIPESDVLVGIFGTTMGRKSYDGKYYTEHEIHLAAESFGITGKPEVWLYFNTVGLDCDTPAQEEQKQAVLAFKNSVQGFYVDYNGPTDFKERLKKQLLIYAMREPPVTAARRLICWFTAQPQLICVEGLTERLSDMTLKFLRDPRVAGVTRSVVNVQVLLNTAITNRHLEDSLTDATLVCGDHSTFGLLQGTNAVLFKDVELVWSADAPWCECSIRDMRANACALGAYRNLLAQVVIGAGSEEVVIVPDPIAISFVAPGVLFSIRTPDGRHALAPPLIVRKQSQAVRHELVCLLRFGEGFPLAFRPREGHRPDFPPRLRASFHNLQRGVRLWVGIASVGSDQNAILTETEVGIFAPVSPTDIMGGVPAAELPVRGGEATAVWEVKPSDSPGTATYDFPVWISYEARPAIAMPGLGTACVNGSFAPSPTFENVRSWPNLGATSSGRSVPVPRFFDLSAVMCFLEIVRRDTLPHRATFSVAQLGAPQVQEGDAAAGSRPA